MKLDQFLIGLLLVAAFISSGMLFILDVHTNYAPYGASIDESLFNSTYGNATDIIGEMRDDASVMEDKSLEGDVAEEDTLDTVVRGSFSAVRVITGSFSLISNLFVAVGNVIGVPSWLIGTAFAAIIILIVFAVIRIFTRSAV